MKGFLFISASFLLFQFCSSKAHVSDEEFLDELERAAFLFFWDEASEVTGQVKDRAYADGRNDTRRIASIAATGYGLTALAIGYERGYHNTDEILARVTSTLHFIDTKLEGHNGFYYHFVDMDTGARVWDCELSSIDTALLLNGVIFVRNYFKDFSHIVNLATKIYEKADYDWFRYGNNSDFISMGWFPENGGHFHADSWNRYCELLMLLLQGVASPNHAIPLSSWDVFRRDVLDYKGVSYITVEAPLFIHQFSHAWYDFEGLRDDYTNYYENSVNATKVHMLWCITDLKENFSIYDEDYWGITASDTIDGYHAWGGPPPMGPLDGSIVPCATAGSIPFLPDETLRVLKSIREKYPQAWQKYGFVDAFNPTIDWWNEDVIGIDVGVTMLMAENYRTRFVWKHFMEDPDVQRSMELVKFRPDE